MSQITRTHIRCFGHTLAGRNTCVHRYTIVFSLKNRSNVRNYRGVYLGKRRVRPATNNVYILFLRVFFNSNTYYAYQCTGFTPRNRRNNRFQPVRGIFFKRAVFVIRMINRWLFFFCSSLYEKKKIFSSSY